MTPGPLKLIVEPVPVTSAGKSLNRLLSKHQWDKIRKRAYAECCHRCAVCGVDPKHTQTQVHPRHAPKLTDPALIERYGKTIEKIRSGIPQREPCKARLECHEVWEYDEATSVQRLSDLLAICMRCHLVKHWNGVQTQRSQFDSSLIKGGLWWYRAVPGDVQKFTLFKAYNPHKYFLEDHFMWVNDCDLKTLVEHVTEAAELNYRRSQHEWEIDYGGFA